MLWMLYYNMIKGGAQMAAAVKLLLEYLPRAHSVHSRALKPVIKVHHDVVQLA